MATIQIERDHTNIETPRFQRSRKRSCIQWWNLLPIAYKIFIIVICLCVILLTFFIAHKYLRSDLTSSTDKKSQNKFVPNPEYILPPSYSTLHLFQKGAVCSDSKECSEIGAKMFVRGGNVVDAAIATLLCNGIATMQSLGIGGGFVMNLFINGRSITLNAKEVAPIAVNNETFKTQEDYHDGPLSIGTPGEIKGYWELYRKYGSLPWKDLIQPSIKLCEDGMILSKHMSDSIGPHLEGDENLRQMLINNKTGLRYKAGDYVYPPKQLCETYRTIAEKGGEEFYSGELADKIVEDLKDVGSIVTKQDLQEYRTVWSDSISLKLDDKIVHITPAPTGGATVALILNILKGFKFGPESIATDESRILTYHRIIEAYKFAFGQRSRIGDPDFVDVSEIYDNFTSPVVGEAIRHKIDDHQTYTDPVHYGADYAVSNDRGTSHVSIIAPNGDAISVTTSVNFYFGSGRSGKRTGIIFNSGLNDFGIPKFKSHFGLSASPANYIKPKKRALSSMSPIIITDENNRVNMVIGAAGGTKIITGIAQTIMRTLWFGMNIKQAVDAARIHHQLEPMIVDYEYGTTNATLSGLEALGHKLKRSYERGSVVCAIFKNSTGIYANADFRKGGDVVGL